MTAGPLPSTEALQVLALKEAVHKLGSYGYQVTGFVKVSGGGGGEERVPTSDTRCKCNGIYGRDEGGRRMGRKDLYRRETQIAPFWLN